MAEYIKRSDAVFYGCKLLDKYGACKMGPLCPDCCCREIRDHFAEIPTADVVERKTGKWIIDRKFGNDIMSGEQMVICSECHKGVLYGKTNFCPNCGAKMEG